MSLRLSVFLNNTKANGIWFGGAASFFNERANLHTHKMRSRPPPDNASMTAANAFYILFQMHFGGIKH